MSRLRWFGSVALILAAVFAFSGIAQARNEGQLLYVEDVVRNTSDTALNGEVTATGNMKVQNIATGTTRTVVVNANATILNPAFTADGKKILFTANPGDLYAVYLVSSQAGTTLTPATPALRSDSIYNLRYATLSPDSDGATTGLLAYTKDTNQATGTHQLWVYDFATKQSKQLLQETNRQIKHPVFLADGTTIAYVGVKNGIQDIFKIDSATGLVTPVTTNESPTPRYGRLVSNVNKSVSDEDVLIYAKQVAGNYGYEKSDIYVRDLNSGIETPVTATSLNDEFEPSFYGNASTPGAVLTDTTGDMFYSADITGQVSVWQTNFNALVPVQSNGAKFERTITLSGLSNWGVSTTTTIGEFPVALSDTRFVFNNADGVVTEISRADANEDGSTTGLIQITTKGVGSKANPSLSGNGGTILCDNAGIAKMNHDGSSYTLVAPLGVSSSVIQPNISSDGKWGVYVRDGDIEVKYLPTGAPILLGSVAVDSLNNPAPWTLTTASNPAFNPDMSQIVFEDTTGTVNATKIWVVRVTIDPRDNSIKSGQPVRLTDTDLQVNDTYPSFSHDGKFIIFTSDRWDGEKAIYAMNSGKDATSGSGVTRIVSAASLDDTNPFAVFGPVNTDANNYYVAYVNEAGVIQVATVTRQICTAEHGEMLVANLASTTGLEPNGKFAWSRERVKGSIYGERVLQSKAVAGSATDYYIKVDVDEAAVQNGYVVQEILPGWTIADVATDITIDGMAVDATKIAWQTGVPASGQNTLKIIFSAQFAAPHDVKDHVIKITATTVGTDGDTQNITGTVEYVGSTGSVVEDISGNNTVLLGSPYCPFDIYNSEGNTRIDTDSGIIENLDLLYAIECWAGDVQLESHLGMWPQDPLNTYDGIIVETINIWATSTGGGAYGEYEFVTPAPVAAEMYWVSGVWTP